MTAGTRTRATSHHTRYGRAVRDRLDAHRPKMTAAALAAAAGVSPSMISHIMSGARRPDHATAARIDTALHAGGGLLDIWDQGSTLRRTILRPRQVPAGPPRVVGRSENLASLDAARSVADVIVLTGPAGVGKTALAIHWAQRSHNRWPGGLLLAALHGHTPGRSPRTTADTLGSLLASVIPAVNRGSIPDDQEQRTLMLHSALRDRGALLILDDAADADQVRPLLGIPGITVIITSRRELPSLAVTHHATTVTVPPLTAENSAELLKWVLDERGDSDPAGVDALSAACANLPQALLAAAQYARTCADTPLSELAATLDGPALLDRLHHAVGGDPHASLLVALDTTVAGLSNQAAAQLLALASRDDPGDLDSAVRGELLRAHALCPAPDGYHLWPPLRAWARRRR